MTEIGRRRLANGFAVCLMMHLFYIFVQCKNSAFDTLLKVMEWNCLHSGENVCRLVKRCQELLQHWKACFHLMLGGNEKGTSHGHVCLTDQVLQNFRAMEKNRLHIVTVG